jgi:NSS family neurotransmitter:Na+ symporter
MKNNKSKWSRNLFFSLATIGAAVGLGNLWRFPYMAFENGGGSFFIPFIICYLLVGLPIALLEFGMGLWSSGSVAEAFKKLNPKTTWMGWWVLINSFVIVCYYAVVMAWCLQYAIYSLTLQWGSDTRSFFFNDVLHITASPAESGNFNWFSMMSLLVLWLITFLILRKGIKGLSKILLLTVPVPFILIVVVAVRSMSFPGGMAGVKYFLSPDMSKVFSVSVWTAAASQVILSLSLGMGQMVAYASMKKDSSKNLRSGILLILGDFSFSLFAGIAAFATFGAMQHHLGQPIVGDTGLNGPALAFITYPAALSALPGAAFWGFAFFFMLVMLGIDSVFAVVEANVTDLKIVFPKISKSKLIGIFCLVSFIGGLPFTMGAGLYWLDIVDHWVGYFAIFSIVILQCIVFGSSPKISQIANHIGLWMNGWIFKAWRVWVLAILPIIFGLFVVTKLKDEFVKPYSDYPWNTILFGGWGIFSLAILTGVIISIKHNRQKSTNEETPIIAVSGVIPSSD